MASRGHDTTPKMGPHFGVSRWHVPMTARTIWGYPYVQYTCKCMPVYTPKMGPHFGAFRITHLILVPGSLISGYFGVDGTKWVEMDDGGGSACVCRRVMYRCIDVLAIGYTDMCYVCTVV